MSDKEKIKKILTDNNFYDVFRNEIYVGGDSDLDLKKEFENNRVTLYLSDDEKDMVSPEDLIVYLNDVLEAKRKEIKKRKIVRPIVFRLYHDEMDNWLRFFFISRSIKDIENSKRNNNDFEFVEDIKAVVCSFLDMRDHGYYTTNSFGLRAFHEYTDFETRRPWKMYQEEIFFQ